MCGLRLHDWRSRRMQRLSWRRPADRSWSCRQWFGKPLFVWAKRGPETMADCWGNRNWWKWWNDPTTYKVERWLVHLRPDSGLILIDGTNCSLYWTGLTMPVLFFLKQANIARWHLRCHIMSYPTPGWQCIVCRWVFQRAVYIMHRTIRLVSISIRIIPNSNVLMMLSLLVYMSFIIIVTSCNLCHARHEIESHGNPSAWVGREVLAAQRAIVDWCCQPRDGATHEPSFDLVIFPVFVPRNTIPKT